MTPPRSSRRVASALTIAGSDSGGGAGIQADLRVFSAFEVHGVSAITAATAQNLRRVLAVQPLSPVAIERQLAAVCEDFDIAAVKIGMLGSAAAVAAVARFLREMRGLELVLDPVLVSSSGTPLLPARAIGLLRSELVPLAAVLTPNLPEAAALLGLRQLHVDAAETAARLRQLGAASVLLKGGHGRGAQVVDVLIDAQGVRRFSHPRLRFAAHGTGCVLSAAIAAGLAKGRSRRAAVADAERYLQGALRRAYRAGKNAVRVIPQQLSTS